MLIKIERLSIEVPAEALADPAKTIPLLVQNFLVQLCAQALKASADLVNGDSDKPDPGAATTRE